MVYNNVFPFKTLINNHRFELDSIFIFFIINEFNSINRKCRIDINLQIDQLEHFTTGNLILTIYFEINR